ncbi:MAG: isoprenylcysteine carboxylmethyltransferase family protein [Ignavibacteria bacterium]|nr:isoprenylcysteine carboxylmethyltransferase family protein [Ignavibacteria bacterium]NCS82748.1 isoprenylcysteine carboxylmethyltransferase family protein [Ignavibacteria bacterium]
MTNKLFKYRSYTPIPFVILMIAYQQSNVWSLPLGLLIAVCGELIRLWAVSWAGSETRTTGKVGGTYLVINGPYAHVRNPLYVGNILIYFGLGIMSFALFPYLQIIALAFFIYQYYEIIKEEEGFLREKFGNDFDEYYKNVPRIFPRLTPYRKEGVEQPEYDLKKGLRSERRTLQAFAIVAGTLIILWFLRRLS